MSIRDFFFYEEERVSFGFDSIVGSVGYVILYFEFILGYMILVLLSIWVVY